MRSGKNFFIENAFGEIYSGTFFADDLPKRPNCSSSGDPVEDAKINEATSKVHMPRQIDANIAAEHAIRSSFGISENFGGSALTSNFAGKIFGGI